MKKRFALKLIAACALAAGATACFSQDVIKIANIVDQPGVLMGVSFDAKGDLDRESFMIEVKNGKQEVVSILPALNSGATAPRK